MKIIKLVIFPEDVDYVLFNSALSVTRTNATGLILYTAALNVFIIMTFYLFILI